MSKPRINANSAPILLRIDEYIRQYNLRGRALFNAASDTLDGHSTRRELDDLISRRLLSVERFDGYEVTGSPEDSRLCGHFFSVSLTERAMRAFWPSRAEALS
jgi:hypothetical protein